MKHRKEGTLERVEYSSEVPGDLEEFDRLVQESSAFCGLPDFVEKAERLAQDMEQSGPLRTEKAFNLRRCVAWIRSYLASGADPSMLLTAVDAGASYAKLCAELRDDMQPPKRPRKIRNRTEYFEMKKKLGTRDRIAEHYGMTPEAVRQWEDKYLTGKNKR